MQYNVSIKRDGRAVKMKKSESGGEAVSGILRDCRIEMGYTQRKIAEYLHIHPKSVHAYQIGEHGDTEFALWSSANIGGQSIDTILKTDALNDIEDYARTEAYSIIEKKGATYYGIGTCVVHIVNCILGDEKRVLSISSYDDYSGVYNGFPTIVGRNGVIRRLDLKLSELEGIKLQKSVNALRDAIKEIE